MIVVLSCRILSVCLEAWQDSYFVKFLSEHWIVCRVAKCHGYDGYIREKKKIGQLGVKSLGGPKKLAKTSHFREDLYKNIRSNGQTTMS